MFKFGLIGEKLGHSLSPEIHGNIFRETSFDADYQLYEIKRENLCNIKEFMRDNSLSGINVTIPYKQEILPFLDEISPEAEKIGAVNTVFRSGDSLIGFNTDYFGFGEMLRYHGISFQNKTVLVLGNGGAAKAVVAYLSDNGAKKVYIVSRNSATDPRVISYDELRGLNDYVIVNTTPVGMYPNVNACAVSDDIIEKSCAVTDLIYNPKDTLLIQKAKQYSKPCCSGMYMLVAQAVKAQEIWRNIKVSYEIINKVFEIQNEDN